MRYLYKTEQTRQVGNEHPWITARKEYSLPYHHPAKLRHATSHRFPEWRDDGYNPVKIDEGEAGEFRFIRVWETRDGVSVIDRRTVTLTPLPPGHPLRGMKPVRGKNV